MCNDRSFVVRADPRFFGNESPTSVENDEVNSRLLSSLTKESIDPMLERWELIAVAASNQDHSIIQFDKVFLEGYDNV